MMISGDYRVGVSTRFSAAHRLYGYSGKCANLHGHTWLVEVIVSGESLDDRGMLCDFEELREVLGKVVEPLDHTCLNDLDHFSEISPTAENVALFIRDGLMNAMERNGWELEVSEVRVWESPDCWASVSGGD